ncbi:MAG: hypothetical protein JKX82_04955 [Oleispira sp.]|nr:hypothetical protein [Oleispira sp.]
MLDRIISIRRNGVNYKIDPVTTKVLRKYKAVGKFREEISKANFPICEGVSIVNAFIWAKSIHGFYFWHNLLAKENNERFNLNKQI